MAVDSSTGLTFPSRAAFFTVALTLVVTGCGNPTSTDDSATEEQAERVVPENPRCPDEAIHTGALPGIDEQERSFEYWEARLSESFDLDEPLLSLAEIRNHNRSASTGHAGGRALNYDLRAPFDESDTAQELGERLSWMKEQITTGVYVDREGNEFGEAFAARFDVPAQVAWSPALHVATAPTVLHCGPVEDGLFKAPVDPDFNRNSCSRIEFGEPVQVLATFGEHQLIRTRFAMGWIAADASLTNALSDEEATEYLELTRRAEILREVNVQRTPTESVTVPTGAELPISGHPDEELALLVPVDGGTFVEQTVSAASVRAFEDLTRRNVLRAAFDYMNDPYGWGGEGGGLDCSRYLLELFEPFGLELPRFSGNQPLASTFHIDVSEVEDAEQKRLIIDAAAEKGLVLLRMNGHIMLYLGRNADGEQRAIHSFAEYLTPCPAGETNRQGAPHTLHRVGHVDISGLELGADTERTSFIERISEIAVIGHPPSYELMGMAMLRQPAPFTVPDPAKCEDSEESALFTTPRAAHASGEMRIIHVAARDPGPIRLLARSPSGEVRELPFERRGAPPFTAIATIGQPEAGSWTIAVGEGETVDACEVVRVRERPEPIRAGSGPVWNVRNQWSPQFESFYAAFVEKLFSYPLEEDLTWTNLQDILQVEEKNLLFDYYSAGEDEELRLQPDCADLPYTLRAYFAWKMGLPFGYRRCSRGREGRPPSCGETLTNLEDREYNGIADAFEYFARRSVMNSVHSGSGRTVPNNDETDYYPVPLTREAIRPGITYIDPDGHLLVVAGWIPQTLDSPGVMYAADAQPDGTIGRRRFWRGSFLFRPETDSVGAGFKAFRPVVYDHRDEVIEPVSNRELVGSTRYIPFSAEQNEGTRDAFYDRVEAIQNPLPVRAETVQTSLIDALEESVSRRINSVDNCEAYMAESGYRTVPMPDGYDIFETSGAWENYSTPARDMRLLISLDTVLGFVDVVARNPQQFGIRPDALDSALEDLRRFRDAELSSRTFEYTRSDGSQYTLTLKDVTDRRDHFEMSYNPNDCPEIRWSAEEGTAEFATCERRAPAAQRAKMREYRTWFENRRRPAR